MRVLGPDAESLLAPYRQEYGDELVEDVLDFLAELPDTLTVYRVVAANSEEEIDTDRPGYHWTSEEDEIPDIAERLVSCYRSRKFMLIGTASWYDIDFWETLPNRLEYPDEGEIAFPDRGRRVKVVGIEEIDPGDAPGEPCEHLPGPYMESVEQSLPALVLVHVDSLGSYGTGFRGAGVDLGKRMALTVKSWHGPIVIVHQGWNAPGAEPVMRAGAQRGAYFMAFDEDVHEWEGFESDLVNWLQWKNGGNTDTVHVGGVWYNGEGEGCAGYTIQFLREAGFNVVPEYDLLGGEDDFQEQELDEALIHTEPGTQGDPLIVYRGGRFDPYNVGRWIFFSTDSAFAGTFAEDGGLIVWGYLNANQTFDGSDPIDLAAATEWWDLNPMDRMATRDKWARMIRLRRWDAIENDAFLSWLEAEGFDSIVTEEDGAVNYGVLSLNQFKEQGRGTWDAEEQRLLPMVDEVVQESASDGDCFANATRAASPDDNERVVHGKVTNADGNTFDHAWIEKGDTVYDPTSGLDMKKVQFYRLLDARPEAMYTGEQATINAIRTRHHGPWTMDEVEGRFSWRADANRQCAWCKKWLGYAERLEPGEVTHAICQDCKDEQLAQAPERSPCPPSLGEHQERYGVFIEEVDRAFLFKVKLVFDDHFFRAPRVEVRALLNGREIGFARFSIGRKYLHARRDEEGVYVIPKYRRRGLASYMYSQAEQHWHRRVKHAPLRDRTALGKAFAGGRYINPTPTPLAESASRQEPWQMTVDEFVKHHFTGWIASHVYDQYETLEGVSWLGDRNRSPVLIDTQEFGGSTIEFRQHGTKNKYFWWDDEKFQHKRDKMGNVIYRTDEEIEEAGLPMYDTTVIAMDGDQPVGWASDEFGATGVWVVEPYQRLGIGTHLLRLFNQQFKDQSRKMGQMTNAGIELTRSYHRALVKDALEAGEEVPEEVLADYPDL